MGKSYDMEGTVKEVMEEVTYASGFNKREFVVTTEDDRFPQDIKCECVKDKTALVEGIAPGDKVKVTFDLRGSNKNSAGRYFVNVTAWRIEPLDTANQPATTPPIPVMAGAEQHDPQAEDGAEQLPF